MQVYNNELYHYGTLGMKWGHHKIIKSARKDAKEFARAKMFYGEGAGTRRKLIKATVEERSKDKIYKDEFDRTLAKQDMSKHADKAKKERVRKDTTETVTKTTKGLMNLSTGNAVKVSSTAVGIYTVAKITGLDKKASDIGKAVVKKGATIVKSAIDKRAEEKIKSNVKNMFR